MTHQTATLVPGSVFAAILAEKLQTPNTPHARVQESSQARGDGFDNPVDTGD